MRFTEKSEENWIEKGKESVFAILTWEARKRGEQQVKDGDHDHLTTTWKEGRRRRLLLPDKRGIGRIRLREKGKLEGVRYSWSKN